MVTRRMLTAVVMAASWTASTWAWAQEAATTSKTFVYKETPKGKLEVVVTYPPGWKADDHRPGIVFFFGGGWTNGNLKQFEAQAEHLVVENGELRDEVGRAEIETGRLTAESTELRVLLGPDAILV